jgi:hypothetical protein
MNKQNQNPQPEAFGVNVWWYLPRLTVEAKQAQDLLVQHGFEKDDMKEPSDRVEVARAVRSFQNRRTKEDRRLTEVAQEKGEAVVYGILDRTQNGDQVGFQQETTVKYDKNANTVSVTGTLTKEVEVALVTYRDKVTDVDVRTFLRRVVRMCQGISKRPSGGIYFVPSRHVGVIESAQQFMEKLATGARLYFERVVNGEQERAIVWEAVEDDIDEQLKAVMAGVDRVEKRVSALKNQQDRVEELRGLMKVYQDLLGREAKYEDMATKLDGAVATIAQKMATLQSQSQSQNPASAAPSGNGTGRGHRQSDYFDAVTAVLKAAGKPLNDAEIHQAVQATGYAGKVPASIYGHLYARAKKGLLKFEGARKFALV